MSDDLVKRLRKVEPDSPGERTRWHRNPDGPEAANHIERLEKALSSYACSCLTDDEGDCEMGGWDKELCGKCAVDVLEKENG